MRWAQGTYFAGVLAVLLPAVLYGQRGTGETRADSGVLQVGFSENVFYDVNPKDAQAITKICVEDMAVRLDGEEKRAEMTLFPSLSSIVKALQAGKLDFLMTLPLEYLKVREEALLRPVWTGSFEGMFLYEYALLVRRDSGVKDPAHLADMRLVMDTGGKGKIPQIWLDTVLLRNELPESRDLFGSIDMVDKPSQALFPVFFGQADACLIPARTFQTMAELNPQLSEQLVVLLRSPGFCRGLMCVSQSIYEEYEFRFSEALSAFNTEPQGQQLLTVFRMDKIVAFEPRYLESTQELIAEYEALRAGVREER